MGACTKHVVIVKIDFLLNTMKITKLIIFSKQTLLKIISLNNTIFAPCFFLFKLKMGFTETLFYQNIDYEKLNKIKILFRSEFGNHIT